MQKLLQWWAKDGFMSNKISGKENCAPSLRKCHWWSWMTHRYLTGKREAEVKIKNRIRLRFLSCSLHLRRLWCEKASSCGDARADHLLRGRVLPLMQRACTSVRACLAAPCKVKIIRTVIQKEPDDGRLAGEHFLKKKKENLSSRNEFTSMQSPHFWQGAWDWLCLGRRGLHNPRVPTAHKVIQSSLCSARLWLSVPQRLHPLSASRTDVTLVTTDSHKNSSSVAMIANIFVLIAF